MKTANDSQPMTSYLGLAVTSAPSRFVFELLTTSIFQPQGRFGHFWTRSGQNALEAEKLNVYIATRSSGGYIHVDRWVGLPAWSFLY